MCFLKFDGFCFVHLQDMHAEPTKVNDRWEDKFDYRSCFHLELGVFHGVTCYLK